MAEASTTTDINNCSLPSNEPKSLFHRTSPVNAEIIPLQEKTSGTFCAFLSLKAKRFAHKRFLRLLGSTLSEEDNRMIQELLTASEVFFAPVCIRECTPGKEDNRA